jgi:hypothetical protein
MRVVSARIAKTASLSHRLLGCVSFLLCSERTCLAPINDCSARDANILHDENWVLDQAELPIETLFRHKEVICGLQRKLVSR